MHFPVNDWTSNAVAKVEGPNKEDVNALDLGDVVNLMFASVIVFLLRDEYKHCPALLVSRFARLSGVLHLLAEGMRNCL